MMFEIPKGYSIVSEEEHADMVRQSAEPVKFETAGVIRKGWLSDIWTVSEGEDEPEYLVDCN
jgi:hypothetical protein